MTKPVPIPRKDTLNVARAVSNRVGSGPASQKGSINSPDLSARLLDSSDPEDHGRVMSPVTVETESPLNSDAASSSPESGASTSLLVPSVTEKKKNKFVYPVGLGLAYWGLMGELLFMWFTRKYVALGVTDTLKAIGVDMPAVPLSYGSDLSIAHPGVELAADLFALGDFIANVVGFDAQAEARTLEADLPEGFTQGIKDLILRCKKEYGTTGITVALMLINFLAGAWADVEPIFEPLKDKIGYWSLGPVSAVMVGGVSYYVFFSGKDVLNSIDYFLGKEEIIPTLPQKSLWKRLTEHGEIIRPLQVAIEGHVQNASRMFSFAFLLGRLADQIGLGGAGIISAQLLGGASGFAISHLTRYRRAYSKYYGTQDNRLDLVTQEMLNDFSKIYSDKPIAQRIKQSFESLKDRPPIVGLAQAISPAYFSGTSVASATAGLLTWQSLVLSITTGAVVGGIAYLPYKWANDQREMCELILKQPKYRLEIYSKMAEELASHIKELTSKPLASNPAEQKLLDNSTESSVKALKQYVDEMKQAIAAECPSHRLSIPDASVEECKQSEPEQTPVSQKIAAYETLISANAASPSPASAASETPEPETPKTELSTAGKVIGTTSNVLSQLARFCTGISSNLRVLKKSDRATSVWVGALNAIVGINNADYMGPKIANTLSGFSVFQTKTKEPVVADIHVNENRV